MTSASAKEAKDKGNAAFKSGDYATAVGQYSAAIVADRTDPTLPLNRAAAYLKLGKNEDAERDCSTVLALPAGKTNVKAMFRRAQARIAIGKTSEAESDLKAALALEPGNDPVKAELAGIEKSKASGASSSTKIAPGRAGNNAASSSSSLTSSPTSQKPYRRRVPITIVDGPTPSKPASAINVPASASASEAPSQAITSPKGETLMSPVSSRSIKSTITPTSDSKPILSPTNENVASTTPMPGSKSQDPWAPRDVPGRKIGGGIIRKGTTKASGQPAISTAAKANPVVAEEGKSHVASPPVDPSITTGLLPAVASSGSTTSARPVPPHPSSSISGVIPTLFDFTRNWNATVSHDRKWELLKSSVPPSELPSLFLTSLEPVLLNSILTTFLALISTDVLPIKDEVLEYLKAFPRVPRFEFVVMFLSPKEQKAVKDIWALYGETPGTGAAAEWKL
ncbi:hypothetical protein FRB95_010555 [Tulasnella sp. JGI-2019a]|nr:hypothetical protein FRB95_010555 [Tulasnella sp. JGI-2019a]